MWASTKIGDPFFRMVFVYSFVLKDLKRRSKILIFSDPLQVESRLFFHWVRTQWWPVSSGCCLILGDFNMGSKMLNRVWILYIYILYEYQKCVFNHRKLGFLSADFTILEWVAQPAIRKCLEITEKKQTYIRLQRVDGKWSANFQAVQVGRVIRRSGSPSRLWQKRQWQSPASAGATLLWACKQHLPSKP